MKKRVLKILISHKVLMLKSSYYVCMYNQAYKQAFGVRNSPNWINHNLTQNESIFIYKTPFFSSKFIPNKKLLTNSLEIIQSK